MNQEEVMTEVREWFEIGHEDEFDELFELFIQWENEHEEIPLIIHYMHEEGIDFTFPVFEFPYYVGYSLGSVVITDLGVTEKIEDDEGSYYCAVIKLEAPALKS